jgi:hypothetical protein
MKSSRTPAGRANFAQIGGCRMIGDVILLVGLMYVLFQFSGNKKNKATKGFGFPLTRK